MRAPLAPLAALAAALLAAVPAAAQPFRSDDPGPIITGSGVAGGAFAGAAFRGLENALFRRVAGGTAFRSAAIAEAMLATAAAQGRAACSGSLEPPRHWPRGVPLDTAAQRAVCGLLECPDPYWRAVVLRALTGGLEGPHVARAEALVDALAGILRRDYRYLDERQRWIDGAAWERAFRAYDAYLSAAPAALLDPPPHELVVVGTILQRVVDAGLDASTR